MEPLQENDSVNLSLVLTADLSFEYMDIKRPRNVRTHLLFLVFQLVSVGVYSRRVFYSGRTMKRVNFGASVIWFLPSCQ